MISMTKTLRAAVILLLAGAAGQGCVPATAADVEQAELEQASEGDVASFEAALTRGGSNQQRLGYTCSGGTCECSKAIENDCEDMTAVCTDATVGGVITCIDGWLTTHCTCKQDTGLVRPTLPQLQLNTSATFTTATIAR